MLCVLAASSPSPLLARESGKPCSPRMYVSIHQSGRIDSLMASGLGAGAVALVGNSRVGTRFLPHDHLLMLSQPGHHRAATRIELPPYTTPPGLAVSANGRTLYVADDTLLLLV